MKLPSLSIGLKSLGLGLLVSSSLVTSPALAAKDWNLTEVDDEFLQTPVCRASTTVAKDATLPVEVSFSAAKDQQSLPILLIKIKGQTERTPYALIRFAKNQYEPVFLLKAATNPAEADVYWYAPRNLKKLVDLIKASNTLDVAFNPKSATPVAVRFSLSGSSATFEQTEKCLKVRDLIPREFLEVLNTESPFGGTLPTEVTAADVLALTQSAYRDYLNGKTVSDALAQLRKAMSPLTKKEAVLVEDLNEKQASLDRGHERLRKSVDESNRLKQENVNLASQLAQLNNDKVIADQVLTEKKGAYDPARATVKPYEEELSSQQSYLRSIRRSIDEQNSTISQGNSAISNLESEASTLRSRVSSWESDERSLESRFRDADWAYSRYDVRSEARNILDRDFRYQDAKRRLPDANREWRENERRAGDARNQARQLEGDLQRCRSEKGKDCSSIESALRSKQNESNDFERRADSAERDVRNYQSAIQSAEWDAERTAESKKRELQNARDEYDRDLREVRDNISDAKNRISTIVNSEIPSWESAVRSARAALPGLKRQKEDAERAVAAAQAALDNIKKQINYDQIESEYRAAVDRVEAIADAIKKNQRQTASNAKAIEKLVPVIADYEKEVQKKTPIRDAAQAKVTEIQAQLAPQRAEEARLNGDLEATKRAIAEKRALYQAEYNKLSEGI